jgi:CubicO group peptidase (beta-lactamase class C family)
VYRSRDWTEYFLSLPSERPPGLVPQYCTAGVIALGRAIQEAAGERFDRWADREFFAPIGIRNYYWEYYDNGRGVDTGGHLHLTPRGLIRIGMMLLDGGRWNSRQVVPEEWINSMWEASGTLDGNPYGYLWWLTEMATEDGMLRVIMARGNGGQSLFLVPQLEIAVVVTAGYYNDPRAVVADLVFANVVLSAAGVQIVDVRDPAASR